MPLPSMRAPRRASVQAPSRQARSRSASSPERIFATDRAALTLVESYGPPPFRRIPRDELLLGACPQPGLAEGPPEAAAGRRAPRSARDGWAREVVVEPHHARAQL